MSVHLFTAASQPATRFTNPHLSEPGKRRRFYQFNRRAQLWCWRCDKRRWAANLVVHVYYDSTRFYCRDGRGCRVMHPRRRAA